MSLNSALPTARKKRSSPLERLLYEILHVCSASMQKSLQSLDNVTAADARAFQNLEGVVLTLEQNGLDENGGRLN